MSKKTNYCVDGVCMAIGSDYADCEHNEFSDSKMAHCFAWACEFENEIEMCTNPVANGEKGDE